MSIFDKLFGLPKDTAPTSSLPSVVQKPRNSQAKDTISLQLLFPGSPNLNTATLQRLLRSYGGSASTATVAIDDGSVKQGTPYGRAQWGQHVVDIVGFDAPMPVSIVEKVVAGAHYPQPLKVQARAHKSHMLLYYAGTVESPMERYVAVAAVAGVLATAGAIVVANETALTSFPALALDPRQITDDKFTYLRDLPLLILYMGFTKYNLEDGTVWMRTYGGPRFGVTALAKSTVGHHMAERTMDQFTAILGYLMDTSATIAAGHTLQISSHDFLKFRAPSEAEYFLKDHSSVLVVEDISPDQINH